MTIEEIKDKILDDQELVTDRSYFKRDYSLLPREGFAIVLTGTRRSGKSSLLRLYAQNLIKEGVGQNRICYLSFFDSSFPANECRIDQIAKAFYSLYPASMKETVYFLLDEVQKLDKWGEGVSRLMDKYDCRVIVTGSSAKFLSTDIATELRGRSISKKFFPLSFREFLRFNGKELGRSDSFSEKEQIELMNLFELYVERGSYPALYNIDSKEERREILSSYFSMTFSIDLIERFEVTKANVLQVLLKRLVLTSGTPLSLRRLKHYMDSIGVKTSLETISSYLEMVKDTMFMRELKILGNENVQNTNPIKLYTADHVMPSLFYSFTKNTGLMYEHIVFSALQRKYQNIFYYKTKSGYEIDFVVTDGLNKAMMLVQVTDDYETAKERENRSFYEAVKELRCDNCFIVTRETMEEIMMEGKTIRILPIWRFLLLLDSEKLLLSRS